MSKILYLCSDWTHNTGNRFIDMGGREALEQATNEEIPILSASCQDLFVRDSKLRQIANKLPREYINPIKPILSKFNEDYIKLGITNSEKLEKETQKSFEIASLMSDQIEFIAFSGMRLTPQSLNRLNNTLRKLREGYNIKILMLGVGGSTYSKKEVNAVRQWMKDFTPFLLTTRDPIAFEKYKDIPEYSYNGIDSAFYINDAFDPMTFNSDYQVVNFDRHPEKKDSLNNNLKTIRTGHKSRNIPGHYLEEPNSFVSSFPEEYLHLYANAKSVYTDRLHACIPSIMFDTPCQYILNEPKNKLFKNADVELVNDELMSPDRSKIEDRKDKHVEFISSKI